jgi:hypothetical protein
MEKQKIVTIKNVEGLRNFLYIQKEIKKQIGLKVPEYAIDLSLIDPKNAQLFDSKDRKRLFAIHLMNRNNDYCQNLFHFTFSITEIKK